jgi:hypothetical protein
VYAAGDAGFLYLLGNDVRLSPDGWDWTVVNSFDGSDAFPRDAIIVGGRVVGVGISSGVPLEGWFGQATINLADR